MKSYIYLLFFVFLSGFVYGQQEHQFTQFMHNKLVLNPAYSGSQGYPVLSALYRRQWLGFEGAPESALVSFHTNLVKDKVGFGLTVANYQVGIFESYSGHMAYSYRIVFSEDSDLRIGLQATLENLSINFNDPSTIIRDQNDASIDENANLSDYSANFGAGIYLTLDRVYFGFSVPNLYPNEIGINSFSLKIAREEPHFYGMLGAAIPMGVKNSFEPSLLAKYVKNAPFDLDANMMFIFNNAFGLGASYRMGGQGTGESVDFLVYFKLGNLGIGGSYDYSLSDIKDYNNGSVEAVIKYEFKKEKDKLSNPRFFF